MILFGHRLALTMAAIALLIASPLAIATGVLDHIRSYDLNDFAFGVAVKSTESAYIDSDNSTFAFRYLTSFRYPAFTDDWLVLSDGNLGARWIGRNDWVIGAVGRINTLGTGSSAVEDLLGLELRTWTIEVAPLVEYRGWPIQINYRYYVDTLDRYGGTTSELKFSLPKDYEWGYLVPGISLLRSDANHNDDDYGVSEIESLPGKQEYIPGAGTNLDASPTWGYAIYSKWLLSGSIRYEWLSPEITNTRSPTRTVCGSSESVWRTTRICFGRGQSILAKREKIKKRTIAKRRLHYQRQAA